MSLEIVSLRPGLICKGPNMWALLLPVAHSGAVLGWQGCTNWGQYQGSTKLALDQELWNRAGAWVLTVLVGLSQ